MARKVLPYVFGVILFALLAIVMMPGRASAANQVPVEMTATTIPAPATPTLTPGPTGEVCPWPRDPQGAKAFQGTTIYPPQSGRVQIQFFVDEGMLNGILDANESGRISGVSVKLYRDGTEVDHQTSGADGLVRFLGLAYEEPHTWKATFNFPAGWQGRMDHVEWSGPRSICNTWWTDVPGYPRATPTSTPTNTVVPSVTPTNTPTNTVVPSVTPTNTPTNTVVPSVTPTNTPTNTVVPSVTPTNTPTNTVVPSVTPTNTPTNTVVPSVTPTNTPTNTVVPSVTPPTVTTPVRPHTTPVPSNGLISVNGAQESVTTVYTGTISIVGDPRVDAEGYKIAADDKPVRTPLQATAYLGRAKRDLKEGEQMSLELWDDLHQSQPMDKADAPTDNQGLKANWFSTAQFAVDPNLNWDSSRRDVSNPVPGVPQATAYYIKVVDSQGGTSFTGPYWVSDHAKVEPAWPVNLEDDKPDFGWVVRKPGTAAGSRECWTIKISGFTLDHAYDRPRSYGGDGQSAVFCTTESSLRMHTEGPGWWGEAYLYAPDGTLVARTERWESPQQREANRDATKAEAEAAKTRQATQAQAATTTYLTVRKNLNGNYELTVHGSLAVDLTYEGNNSVITTLGPGTWEISRKDKSWPKEVGRFKWKLTNATEWHSVSWEMEVQSGQQPDIVQP